MKTMELRVWYGLRKLTPKIVKKPSIIVIFENSYLWKNEISVKQKMKVLHTRFQTEDEMADAEYSNRVFTIYEMKFLHDKRYQKSPELAIQNNFLVDSNNVTEQERLIIADKLRKEIYNFYNIIEPKEVQLQIF